jgi:hypothetical protein
MEKVRIEYYKFWDLDNIVFEYAVEAGILEE